ncbi:MAG: antibiotic biosynthesis monooxygenase, partial [Vampirovibrio sp.]|nr:antibiotic biosynthesis monooxygenase [Vampirovibrio sp.]
FEEWQDQAAIDAHFEMPHFKNFQAKMLSLISDVEPELVIYEVRAAVTV